MSQTADMLADGNVKVAWVPAIADINNPTVTELTATGVVDLSCFIQAGGLDHTTDEDSVNNAKLCDTTNYESPGRIKENITVTYVRKQASTDDKAYQTLKRLTLGNLVLRYGKPYSDAFAADDEVTILTSQCGAQQVQSPDANQAIWVKQKLFNNGPVANDVKVVAGA